MRAVVTGTRDGRLDVAYWLDRFVRRVGVPELFILGEQRGVDTQARDACERRRWSYVRIFADEAVPSPKRYHDRNQRMVDLASPGDYLLAFPDDRSRGTWDCYGRGEKRGLRCSEMPSGRVELRSARGG